MINKFRWWSCTNFAIFILPPPPFSFTRYISTRFSQDWVSSFLEEVNIYYLSLWVMNANSDTVLRSIATNGPSWIWPGWREKGITSESTTIKKAFWLGESCFKGGGDRQLSMENIYYMYMAQKRPGPAIWKKGRGSNRWKSIRVKSAKILSATKRLLNIFRV